jgi:PAS domain S-box-containing protein
MTSHFPLYAAALASFLIGSIASWLFMRRTVRNRKELPGANASSWRDSRSLFSLMEAIPVPVFLTDDHGVFFWANQAFARQLGCVCGSEDRTAVLDNCRRSAEALFPANDPFLTAQPSDQASSMRKVRLQREDGLREMELRLAWAIREDGSKAVVGALQDNTEVLAANRRLETALTELKNFLDNSRIGVTLVRNDALVKTNGRFEEILGYAPGELQGRRTAEIFFSENESLRQWREVEKNILQTGEYLGEQLLRRKDGAALWARMQAKTICSCPDEGFILTVDDFTERKRMEQELVAAKEAAEAANMAKTHFLANMSHELRTPLNAVTGLTAMLLSSELAADQREMAVTIRDATEQLLAVLSDILDYARFDTETLEPEEHPFDLVHMLERISREMQPRAQQKALHFRLDLPQAPLFFVGDHERLRRILFGLLGNAIKFTDQGEIVLKVDVTVPPEAQTEPFVVHFAVEDTGVGICDSEMGRIFDVFHQADESVSRRYGGAGVGLAICRRMIHLLGGAISVQSEPGQGTAFLCSIPLKPASQEQIAQLEDHRLAEEAACNQNSKRSLSILLAEDNHVNQKVLVKLLGRRGHSVHVVANGRHAVEALERTAYDIVLMDIQMPEMDGVTATKIIRAHEDLRVAGTPIVAFTAHALQGDRERFIQAGMNEYTPKPVNPVELEAAMASALGDAPPRTPPPAPVADEDPSRPLLDITMALERLDNDQNFLFEMFALYLEDAPVRIQEIRAAHQEGRLRDAGDLAHSLKGISLSVGAAKLADLAHFLEKSGRGGDLNNFESGLDELEPVYEATAEAIRRTMEQICPT